MPPQPLSRRFPFSLSLLLVSCVPEKGTGNTDTDDTVDTDTAPEWPAAPTVLDNLTVVDASGVRAGRALILAGDEIWAVTDARQPWPADASVQDLSGQYVIPGLIDAHTHLFHSGSLSWVGDTLAANLQAQLAWGIVGVADLGSPVEIFELRDQIAAGQRLGPRIWATGPFLTATGAHPCENVRDTHLCVFVDQDTSPAEAVAALSRADGLKVALADAGFTPWPTPRLDLGDLAEIIAAAGDTPVWVHIDEPADLADADAAGAAVMAHPIFSEAVSTYPAVTTTSAVSAMANLGALVDGRLLQEDLSHTPAAVQAAWALLHEQPELLLDGFVDESAGWEAATRANLALAVSEGRTILPGSDAGYWFVPHGVSLHRELVALVDAGMSPLEALTAATATNAAALGWDDLGHIGAGYRADFVILSEDPSADIDATRAISAVWLAGVPLDQRPDAAPEPTPDGFCLDSGDCTSGQRCDRVDHVCRAACDDLYAFTDTCGADGFCMSADAYQETDGVCHPGDGCDPYAQDCEPSYYQDNCTPYDVDTALCVASGPQGAGQACSLLDPARACRQGMYCSRVDYRCYVLCDPAESTPGCRCVRQDGADGWAGFGLCL